MKMKKVNPHPNETYQVGIDDGCLVVSSGSNPASPKVHLSKSMLEWIAHKGISKYNKQLK